MDQTNVAERNHQVGLMSQVYSRASAVYAWIGPAIESFRTSHINAIIMHKWHLTPSLASCLDILAKSYWTRLWIVQEIRLAHHVIIWYGTNRILWTMLHNMNRATRDHHWRSRKFVSRIFEQSVERQQLNTIIDESRYDVIDALLSNEPSTAGNPKIKPPKLSWTKALEIYGRSKCQDDRDKIFALQALVKPEDRVKVDYTKSFSEVSCLILKKQLIHLKHSVKNEGLYCFPQETKFTQHPCMKLQRLCRALNQVQETLQGQVDPKSRDHYYYETRSMWWSLHFHDAASYTCVKRDDRGRVSRADWRSLWRQVYYQAIAGVRNDWLVH